CSISSRLITVTDFGVFSSGAVNFGDTGSGWLGLWGSAPAETLTAGSSTLAPRSASSSATARLDSETTDSAETSKLVMLPGLFFLRLTIQPINLSIVSFLLKKAVNATHGYTMDGGPCPRHGWPFEPSRSC